MAGNNTTTLGPAPAPPADPDWISSFKKFQLFIVSVGLMLNVLGVVVFFTKATKSFNVMTLMLLKHQTCIDSLICLLNVFYLVPNLPDSSSIPVACYLWYTQTFYWILVVLSVWNLLLICVERFMAVVFPIKYKAKKPVHVAMMIMGIHLGAYLLATPVTFWVRYSDGVCLYGTPTFDSPVLAKFLTVHAALWFLGIYLCPMVAMVVMYTKIVLVIRAATGNTTSSDGKQSNAATEFTKTAIVITTVFVVSFSFDSFYYFIGTFSPTINYEVNSTPQIFSTFMVTLNSCCAVIIYLIFMRVFRKHSLQLLSCGRYKGTGAVGGQASGTTSG